MNDTQELATRKEAGEEDTKKAVQKLNELLSEHQINDRYKFCAGELTLEDDLDHAALFLVMTDTVKQDLDTNQKEIINILVARWPTLKDKLDIADGKTTYKNGTILYHRTIYILTSDLIVKSIADEKTVAPDKQLEITKNEGNKDNAINNKNQNMADNSDGGEATILLSSSKDKNIENKRIEQLKSEIQRCFGDIDGTYMKRGKRDPQRDVCLSQVRALINNPECTFDGIKSELQKIADTAQKDHEDNSGTKFLGCGPLINKTCGFKKAVDEIITKFRNQPNIQVDKCSRISNFIFQKY